MLHGVSFNDFIKGWIKLSKVLGALTRYSTHWLRTVFLTKVFCRGLGIICMVSCSLGWLQTGSQG